MLEVKRKPASPSHGHGAAAPAKARAHTDGATLEIQPANTGRAPIPAQPLSDVESKNFQNRSPVITGEVQFNGSVSVNGWMSGQLGTGNGLTVKQRSTTVSEPELSGDISFKDMVRINGHITGSVHSKTGTVIVDSGAKIEAHLDVAVALINGIVKGDIVARERVELGPTSRIYGNIWTRSLVIKNGAIFEGVCHMIEEAQAS
jgi:cytoskeletal protein CcmA (bactofilin family)